jgi:type 1 fimbria pilin
MLKKMFPLLGACLLFLGFAGCTKNTEESPRATTEEITIAIAPANQEIKGDQFSLRLSDLKILETVDTSTREATAVPQLRGTIKINNTSKNILQIQGVTFQYRDASGNLIPFKNGDKNATVSMYSRDLQPGKETENSLDIKIPVAAVKNKTLGKIEANVVYVPIPLKNESVEMPVKIPGA